MPRSPATPSPKIRWSSSNRRPASSAPMTTSLCRRASTHMDWEVEFGFVIGRTARGVAVKDAMKYVAGYCLINDVSEREYQMKRSGTQWNKGKGCDTFGPIGPWLVTTDEMKDPQDLDMWLDVNGRRGSRATPRTMIFSVAQLVADMYAVPDAASRRSGDHRNAARRGHGNEARAEISEGGRRDDAGHRGARRAAAESRGIKKHENGLDEHSARRRSPRPDGAGSRGCGDGRAAAGIGAAVSQQATGEARSALSPAAAPTSSRAMLAERFGEPEADLRGGEPAGCVEHHRGGPHRQGAGRRLHAAARHQHRPGDRAPHPQARLRSAQGPAAGRPGRGRPQRAAGEHVGPGQGVGELVKLMKEKPGSFRYASSGVGSTQHLAGEAFDLAAGTKSIHIPYKGSSQAHLDLIGGQVEIMFDTTSSAMPTSRPESSSRWRSRRRSAPSNCRTCRRSAEAGLPGAEMTTWYGLFATGGTPKPVIEQLHAELKRTLAIRRSRRALTGLGGEIGNLDIEAFADFNRADYERFGKLIRDAGIKLE